LPSNLFDLRSYELNSSNVQLKADLYTRKFVCGNDDYNDNDEKELVKEFNLDMASSSFTSSLTPTTTSTPIDTSSSTLTATHLNHLTPPVTPPPILKHAKMSPSSSRSPSSRNINIGSSRPSPPPPPAQQPLFSFHDDLSNCLNNQYHQNSPKVLISSHNLFLQTSQQQQQQQTNNSIYNEMITGDNKQQERFKNLKPSFSNQNMQRPMTMKMSIQTNDDANNYNNNINNRDDNSFIRTTHFPLSSSPAPMRKSGTCLFDFDNTLKDPRSIKKYVQKSISIFMQILAICLSLSLII
jgi:hypothetical protein